MHPCPRRPRPPRKNDGPKATVGDGFPTAGAGVPTGMHRAKSNGGKMADNCGKLRNFEKSRSFADLSPPPLPRSYRPPSPSASPAIDTPGAPARAGTGRCRRGERGGPPPAPRASAHLLHATHHHAHVCTVHDHRNSHRLQGLLEGVRDLPREALLHLKWGTGARDALEGKGPSEAASEAVRQVVGGGYCRLQMPLRLALGVRGTVAGHRLGALEGGGGGQGLA